MITDRLVYRTRQAWAALRSLPSDDDLNLAARFLSDPQLTLFKLLQGGEQAHSVHALRALLMKAEPEADLCVAVLLHDVGKIRCPLNLVDRVLIVLAQRIIPAAAQRWGEIIPGKTCPKWGWRKPFVVAMHHPRWGAEMAYQAGASALAVELIQRHQEKIPAPASVELSRIEQLLTLLQSVDDNS